jgi:hypothetical protein
MSMLLDTVIVTLFEDEAAITAVNKYLYDHDEYRHQQFNKMDNDSAGGSKVASMTVYQACFNHLVPEDVKEAVDSAKWSYPMLVIMDYEFDSKPFVYYSSDWDMTQRIYGWRRTQ